MAKQAKKQLKKGRKGFTIIEVVLVLAIAGLIFLMVFIALPALQSSQRNTQREDDLARFLTAITDYQSNNSGRLPFDTPEHINNLVTRYIDDTCDAQGVYTAAVADDDTCAADQFRDPDGTIYHFADSGIESENDELTFDEDNGNVDHTIYYAVGFMCGPTERSVVAGTGGRQVALFMKMEGGGVSCNANS